MAATRTMADERADATDAFQNTSAYRAELDDIHKYYMPFRKSTSQQSPSTGGQSPGASRTDHLFDGTGLSAAFNFAGNMSADWMPPFQDFFTLEAGPFVPADQKAEINRQLVPITQMVHGALGRTRLTAHEMFLDLFAGTGAMFMAKGTAREPIRSQAVPTNEIALVDGPFGDPWGIYWKKNYKARHLPDTWPDGEFSPAIKQLIDNKRATDVEIMQATTFDAKKDEWILKVWAALDDAEKIIFEEKFYTNPWTTPRFFKVPGESMGRGLAHIGLPFVKTANKTRELALRAAAFALMGIWMRRNDGVFNPDNSTFKPLAMWTVASTGGPLGRTIERLPVPQDFDVQSIVMNDERDQIKRVLLDDDLPELQDSVRSPTEIAARLRRAAKSKGGAGSRISLELVTAMVQRAVDILETSGMLGSSLKIDQLVTQVTVTAPSAAAQRADKVSRTVDYLQMVIGLFGREAAAVVAKVEDMLPKLGRDMGVDETDLRTGKEQKQFKEILRAILAEEINAQAKAAAKGGAQQQPAPAAQYVNGGAM